MPSEDLAELKSFWPEHRATLLVPGIALKWPLTIRGVTSKESGQDSKRLGKYCVRTWLGLTWSKEALHGDQHVLQTFRGRHCVGVDLFCCLLLLQRMKLGFKKRGGLPEGSLLISICWGRGGGGGV